MKYKVSRLDWIKLAIIWFLFLASFIVFDSVMGSLLWAYVGGVVLFNIGVRVTRCLFFSFLIGVQILLFLGLMELSNGFGVNSYYLLCILIFSELYNNYKFKWVDTFLNKYFGYILNFLSKIQNRFWGGLFIIMALIGVSGRYFFTSGIPYNSFLDLGGRVVHSDVWKQIGIGWSYQFGMVWNVLSSDLSIIYINTLALFSNSFYLGIKLHQFLSIVVGAVGVIMLWRAIMPKLTDRVAGISAQVLVALIYVLNPFYLSVLNGVVEFGVAYSLMPWIILFWLKLIHNRDGKWWQIVLNIISTGVILSFATVVSGITLVFTNIIPLAVIMLGLALVKLDSKQELFRRVILFVSVWLIVVLMGLHTIVPTFGGYKQVDGILDSSEEGRKITFIKDYYSPNVLEIMYLQNKEAIVSEELGYTLLGIPLELRLIWFFWSSLGIISIIWFRKNKYIIPIWGATGIAGYLALGYSNSWLYRVLNEYFPYFWGLRTPGRFMMVFVLGISVLGALVWYYVLSGIKNRNWQLGRMFGFGLAVFLVIISARHQSFEIKTFSSIPSIDYHLPDVEEAQQALDKLNSNMEYRVLDLTRDDDGAWHHTRVMSAEQRVWNYFEKFLIQYPAQDWAKILRDNNVKYVVASEYDDYCDYRFDSDFYNDKNIIGCYLLQRKNSIKPLNLGLKNYTIYEVQGVKPYISGEGIEQNFSYNPIVKTGDKEQKVRVAEIYSPPFKWTCNGDNIVESSPERDGLIQASILPANSECKFGYHKPWSVLVADWIFYGLFGVAVGAWIWTIGKFVVRRR